MYGISSDRASEPILTCSTDNVSYPVYGHESVYEYHREKMLNDTEKVLYDEIKEAYLQFKTEFSTSVKSATYTELDNALKAVILDHPEIFWSKSFSASTIFGKINTSKVIKLNYFYSKSDAIAIKEEIEPKFDEIVTEASKLDTDYEKIKYVHNKLIEIGTYTEYEKADEADYQSFVSIIRDGKTVCSGFAYSFKYVMDKLGIESIIIADINEEEGEESHIWNIVSNNEKWYNLDITYDNEITEQIGKTSYLYFMQENSIFYLDHEIQDDVPKN